MVIYFWNIYTVFVDKQVDQSYKFQLNTLFREFGDIVYFFPVKKL